MDAELPRQFVHLSGILFVILAQFTGNSIAFLFFLIAFVLLIWAWNIKTILKKSENIISRLEHGFRDIFMRLERSHVKTPFTGAIWFYLGCGIAFLLFPLPTASAACIILSVGDAFSTIIGKSIGKKKIFGKKTFEGSFAFFFSSVFASMFFISLTPAIMGCLVATLTEMFLGHEKIERIVQNGWLDDNLFIPLLAAIVISLV